MNKPRRLLFAFACLPVIACEVHFGDPTARQPAGAQPATAVAPPAPATTSQTTPAPPPPPARVIPLHLHSDAPAPVGSPPAAPPPPSCLGNGAAAIGDCNAMQPPDATCAASPAAKQKCSAYKANFTPQVAAAAVACMTVLSSRQVCDAAQWDSCARSSLAQACPDGSVAQLCSIAASPCKTSAGDCTSMLSGLNDQGRQRVAQCIAQGCSAGLYPCVQGLAY
jgi:hypothetical protein